MSLKVAEYTIPLSRNVRRLPISVRPFDREILRSFFRRIAIANSLTPLELLLAIQPDEPQYRRAFPAGFGVKADPDFVADLARALRCSAADIQSCLLPQDRLDPENPPAHPHQLRACVECQRADGAWRRWNLDPLYAICPIHETLLWDSDPDGSAYLIPLFLNGSTAVGQTAGQPQSKFLLDLQNQLVSCRKSAVAQEQAGLGPTQIVTNIATLYRRTLDINPGNRDLRKLAKTGWAEMKRLDRAATPASIKERALRAEDIAAVLPEALPIVNAAIDGDVDPYDDLVHALHEASGGKRFPRSTNPGTENTFTVEKDAA